MQYSKHGVIIDGLVWSGTTDTLYILAAIIYCIHTYTHIYIRVLGEGVWGDIDGGGICAASENMS